MRPDALRLRGETEGLGLGERGWESPLGGGLLQYKRGKLCQEGFREGGNRALQLFKEKIPKGGKKGKGGNLKGGKTEKRGKKGVRNANYNLDPILDMGGKRKKNQRQTKKKKDTDFI